MKSRKRYVIGMIVGAVLGSAPVFAGLAVALAMKRAFDAMGSSGVGDPGALSGSISLTLGATATGLALFVLGAGVFLISAIRFARNRPPSDPDDPALLN